MARLINCVATHLSGMRLYVELTPEQAHAPADAWSDERVIAFEDDGSGELRLHEVRLADLSDLNPE